MGAKGNGGNGGGGGSLRWSKRDIVGFAVFGVFYFCWYGLLVGLTATNVIVFPIIFLVYFGSRTSRQALFTFAPLLLYIFFYDSNRVLRKFNLFQIHTSDIYHAEVKLLGVYYNGTKISLNEYFAAHTHVAFDVFAGLFYITWVPFPALFSALLFIKGHRELAFRFWVAMFFTTSLGFVLYITCPAAPPWYYLRYGEFVDVTAPGDPAGLARFDQLTGLPIYATMYSQNQNVFAAMPSMHAAFPTALTFYSLKYGNKWLIALFATSALGIWFGAVYASHHYVLDLMVGWLCVLIGIAITELWFRRSAARKDSWLSAYLKLISDNNHSHHSYQAVAQNDNEKIP